MIHICCSSKQKRRWIAPVLRNKEEERKFVLAELFLLNYVRVAEKPASFFKEKQTLRQLVPSEDKAKTPKMGSSIHPKGDLCRLPFR